MFIIPSLIREHGADSHIPLVMATDALVGGIETTGNYRVATKSYHDINGIQEQKI